METNHNDGLTAIIIGTLMLTLVLCSNLFQPSHAQLFGHNIAISNSQNSSEPEISSYGNNVYVVWSESTQFSYPPKYEIFIKTSRDNGTTFGDGVNLSNNNGSSVDPNIAISQDKKTVFVVWSDSSKDNSEIELVRLQI